MMAKRKRTKSYSVQQKEQILETVKKAIEGGETAASAIEKCGIATPTFYEWRKRSESGESLDRRGYPKQKTRKAKKEAKPNPVLPHKTSGKRRVVYVEDANPSGKEDYAKVVKYGMVLESEKTKLEKENRILRDMLIDREMELYALKH